MSSLAPSSPRSWSARHLTGAVALLAACTGGGAKLASTGSTPAGAGYAPAYGDRGGAAEVAPSSAGMATSPGGGEAIALPAPDRPGLGTTWGEATYSPVRSTPFRRASAAPWATAAVHYNDRDGVLAHAAHLGAGLAPLQLDLGDGAVGLSLIDDRGQLLPGFHAGPRVLVAGEDGQRYRLLVRNATPVRFEVVASVDGLDVVDGQPASTGRRGYVVEPHDSLVIDGFRTSDDAVAAFRFGAVADSYAAQSSGDRNVGVIGVALFTELGAPVWSRHELELRETADPFPAGRAYALPPN